jgi:hypothetical protein
LISSPLYAGNNIGNAGAAAVAGALEPRRNGDGSWTPSTTLTVLGLEGEWALISMVVSEEELGCSCVSIVGCLIPSFIKSAMRSIGGHTFRLI